MVLGRNDPDSTEIGLHMSQRSIMKLAVILLCVALVGGANASFGDFLHSIGNTLKPIVGVLDTTVTSVLKNVVNTGKNLLAQTLQALLLNIGNAAQKQRDLSGLFHIIPSIESTVHGILDRGHSLFSDILNKLTTGLTNVIDKVSHFDISSEAVVEKVDQLVGTHNLLVDGILGHVVSSLEGALSSHKRSALTDALSGLSTSMKDLFQQHTDAIKDHATTACSLIKNAAVGTLNAGNGLAVSANGNTTPTIEGRSEPVAQTHCTQPFGLPYTRRETLVFP
ncbi:uncharacterized protein LOC121372322 [Gigantopelta aegis]|uniref:uncharacterized protein LOC121372322 n=1 Tax=Gigantopelta aegis TaxID=1735272 RepID=UPI001B88E237|nr:uncharacterized protein LOC121372322 [Gigantopelta aegis]